MTSVRFNRGPDRSRWLRMTLQVALAAPSALAHPFSLVRPSASGSTASRCVVTPQQRLRRRHCRRARSARRPCAMCSPRGPLAGRHSARHGTDGVWGCMQMRTQPKRQMRGAKESQASKQSASFARPGRNCKCGCSGDGDEVSGDENANTAVKSDSSCYSSLL